MSEQTQANQAALDAAWDHYSDQNWHERGYKEDRENIAFSAGFWLGRQDALERDLAAAQATVERMREALVRAEKKLWYETVRESRCDCEQCEAWRIVDAALASLAPSPVQAARDALTTESQSPKEAT